MINSLLNYILRKRFFPLIAWLAAAASAVLPFSSVQTLSGEPFRYLAIGNSITRHPECAYWWSEAGMAASQPERDYFHIVTDYLAEEHESVSASAVNFVEWEIAAADKSSTYSVIDPLLSEDLDLITLQLSENAVQSRSLGKNLADLVRYIQKKCPKAQLIIVDDFWSNAKSSAKKKTARSLNIPFADLSAIRGKEEYMQSLGSVVYGSDGGAHIIDREDVAKHPNDKGMAAIAQAIIKQIKKLK